MGRRVGARFRPTIPWRLKPAHLPNPIDLVVKRYSRTDSSGAPARCGPSADERLGVVRPLGAMGKKIIYPDEVSAGLARDALSHVTGRTMYSYHCGRNERAGSFHYHLATRKPPRVWGCEDG